MQMAPQEVRTFFVTALTWGRRPIFLAEPMALLFLDTLRNHRIHHHYLLHEFVLMPEHFHLLLTPVPDVSLQKALHTGSPARAVVARAGVELIRGGFSFRVKHEMGLAFHPSKPKAGLLGTPESVWQPRPTNHRIRDADDYARHVEYIRQNPVKRHLVENPQEYPYSSASAALEVDPAPPGLKARFLRTSGSPG